MKTRSSRFFVILLHLLGVPNHHLPSWYYDYLTSTTSPSSSERTYSGIRGVHPHSIVLERLDLREVGGLDGVEWLLGNHGTAESASQEAVNFHTSSKQPHVNREPFWLQDTEDGKCLGPSGGFSECGDATLWFVLKKKSAERKSLRMGPFGVEEVLERLDPDEPFRYALQIVDNDYLQHPPSPSSPLPVSGLSSFASSWKQRWVQRQQQQRQRDCLVPSTNQVGQANDAASIELGSCAKQKTAWTWRVDNEGLLYSSKKGSKTRVRQCLRRTKSSTAVMSSCHDGHESKEGEQQGPQRLVQFSLVRYRATANPSLAASSGTNKLQPMTTSELKGRNRHSKNTGLGQAETEATREGLPSNRDIAHSHASGPVMHSPIFEMNLAGRPLLSNIPSREARKESNRSPFAALKDSNPILFLGADYQEPAPKLGDTRDKIKPGAVGNTASPHLSSPTPVKLRKIEMNPYIAASKDEIWVDPLTGLEYHTDLCRYLGHNRKEYGRHTLVGVGQYMKTMLKIKVYGIAFYVSKRDVLADPSFQEFAGLSAEDLRDRPDFYGKLREDGAFDRTLLLKTNMQLSTETMRSSLDSDWKLLSEEAKNLLIDTSMRPRPAEEQMLQEIQRADNPSRCSCAQVAPEELQADPSCCARGIELVFTWRKNGDLEVRLNGRLMDGFPRPDIGHGIFFEYLRLDDPFSADFIERAVDGFPHLLSPLAQVQGITTPVMQAAPKAVDSPVKALIKTFGSAAESVSSHATGVAGAMHHAAAEAASHAAQAAQSAGDSMRHFGEEAERKRQEIWERMVEMSQQNPAEVFAEFSAQVLAVGERQPEQPVTTEVKLEEIGELNRAPHGRFFQPVTSQWFGETLDAPDEIGPMIHPTMNKTILSLVHLYLLLILIVSFPPTNSNRTRFVVRRSCKMMSASPSEASLVERIEKGRDSIVLLKQRNLSLHCDQKITRGAGKKMAPVPPTASNSRMETGPEEDGNNPAEDSDTPQRIHIDLSLQGRMECKKNSRSNGNARFFLQSLKTEDGVRSENASIISVASEGSRGRAGKKNGRKDSKKNENMKKSLSYFL